MSSLVLKSALFGCGTLIFGEIVLKSALFRAIGPNWWLSDDE